MATITQISPSIIRVTYDGFPLTANPSGENDALNKANYIFAGPGVANIDHISTVSGDPASVDILLVDSLPEGDWLLSVSSNVQTALNLDTDDIGSGESYAITIEDALFDESGATTSSIEDILRSYFNPALKGKAWDALLAALATGDKVNQQNVELAFDQLFISSASDKYLTVKGHDNGVDRPAKIGLEEEDYRKLVIKLKSLSQSQESLLSILEVFYGVDAVKAFDLSSAREPYALEDGDTLDVLIDETYPLTVTFNSEDFTDISAATAKEVCAVINREISRLSINAFATPWVNPRTFTPSISISPPTFTGQVGDTQQLIITATYDDGSTEDVTPDSIFSSDDEAIATVDSEGLITAVFPGSATITVTFGGFTQTCEVTINVTLLSLTVLPSTFSGSVGDTQQLLVTADYDDSSSADVTNECSYFSSDTDVSSVSITGLITAEEFGLATITASLDGESDTCDVTVQAEIVSFIDGTMPTDVTADSSKGDKLFLQTSENTSSDDVAVGVGVGVFENWGTEYGLWSFDAYENRIGVDPGWGEIFIFTHNGSGGTPSWSVGPCPSITPRTALFGDSSLVVQEYASWSPPDMVDGLSSPFSVWVRGEASGPNGLATANGTIEGFQTSLYDFPVVYTTDTIWRRYISFSISHNPCFGAVLPAGEQGVVGETGDAVSWGRSLPQRADIPIYSMLPLATTTVGATSPHLTGTSLNGFLDNGILDVEGEFRIPMQRGRHLLTSPSEAGLVNSPFTIFSADCNNGKHIQLWLEYGYDISDFALVLQVGTDVVYKSGSVAGEGFLGGNFGDKFYWRIHHNVNTGDMVIRSAVNGNFFRDKVFGSSATETLDSLTDAWLGSDSGTSEYLDALHLKVHGMAGLPLTVTNRDGIVTGDSIWCNTALGAAALLKIRPSDMIYEYTQSEQIDGTGNDGILTFAVSGAVPLDQTGTINTTENLPTNVTWGIVALGINSISTGVSATDAEIELETHIAAIKARWPGIFVLVTTMTPCKTYLDSVDVGYWTEFQALNARITGNLIDGQDDFIDTYTPLDDGAGSIAAIYNATDPADDLHPNDLGRREIGAAAKAKLIALGYLP